MYGQLHIVATEKCHYKLGLIFKNVPDLHRIAENTIYKWLKSFTATDSILDSNRMHKTYVKCEKLDETGTRFETSPRKSLAWLAQHTGVTVSLPQNVMFASVCDKCWSEILQCRSWRKTKCCKHAPSTGGGVHQNTTNWFSSLLRIWWLHVSATLLGHHKVTRCMI